MPLITDRDLLRIEPSAFLHATAAATKVLSTTDGAIAGTTLTSAASNFVTSAITSGQVAVVAGEALEIVDRLSATTLTVSRARRTSDAVIAPAPGSSLAFAVWTFNRLIEDVEAFVLQSMRIDEGDAAQPLDAAAILNAQAVGRLIALIVLERAFAASAAQAPADEPLAERAHLYARRASSAKHSTLAVLDLDGDGIADATRRFSACAFLHD
jgi:hypothetical protein